MGRLLYFLDFRQNAKESTMHDGALRRVCELPQDARLMMERIVGRSLLEDEVIAVNVYKAAPIGPARVGATRLLIERIERTAQSASGVPEEEIDAAIDEAAEFVRHHPE
jgi:hypothetical protein